jgi:DNA repair protein RadC
MSDAPPDATGHRERLRRRLLDHGGEGLADYEIVEYLLALAIPRRDTKSLAKALLREFGGLGPLLAASPAQVMRVDGIGERAAAALRIVNAAALRLLRQHAKEGPVLASWQALLDYLQADMAHIGTERVRLLHLDTKNRLIRDEVVAEGSIDQATVHIRELLRRAIELSSASLILVHNHPSGDPSPSRQDIVLTKEIAAAAKPLGIVLHDHIVIGTSGHASLKALGVF